MELNKFIDTFTKQKIESFLFSDRLQRVYYLTLLIFWSYSWRNDIICCYDSEAILGIQNIYFIIIPFTLLTIQVFYNHIIPWILLYSIVVFLSLYKIYTMMLWQLEIIDGEYAKSKAYQKEELINYAIILSVITIILLFFYKLKPNKITTKDQ